jgi:hypothetical protein
MQTVTVEISNKDGLKALENLADKHFIRIVSKTEMDTPALAGEPLSIAEFKNWISEAENTPHISLTEAKNKWAGKRKLLQKLTK